MALPTGKRHGPKAKENTKILAPRQQTPNGRGRQLGTRKVKIRKNG